MTSTPPITLSEAEARAVYAVLVRELEAVPSGEQMFVDLCQDGDAEQIAFLGSRSERSWANSKGRRLEVPTSRFSVVAGPLRVVCSEDAVSTSQFWAAADASALVEVALAALETERSDPSLSFQALPRERLSVLAA